MLVSRLGCRANGLVLAPELNGPPERWLGYPYLSLEAGDRGDKMSGVLSVAEGLNPMLPNAGLSPVGERWSSPSPCRRTSTISGRIMGSV